MSLYIYEKYAGAHVVMPAENRAIVLVLGVDGDGVRAHFLRGVLWASSRAWPYFPLKYTRAACETKERARGNRWLTDRGCGSVSTRPMGTASQALYTLRRISNAAHKSKAATFQLCENSHF